VRILGQMFDEELYLVVASGRADVVEVVEDEHDLAGQCCHCIDDLG
jgi:hypothetical protein